MFSTTSLTRQFNYTGGDKPIAIRIVRDTGMSISDLPTGPQAGRVVVRRVTPGTGGLITPDCAWGAPGMSSFLPGLEGNFAQIGLVADNLISGGAVAVFERMGLSDNEMIICSDTPVGIYYVTLAAIDGVGSRRFYPLTVEVLEEQVDGGSLEWLP